jgi:hypothetical protein
MARRNQPMFSMPNCSHRRSTTCSPLGFFFLLLLVKRSVNWLPLSVSSLQILIGQAAFTLAKKSTLLLSVWSA